MKRFELVTAKRHAHRQSEPARREHEPAEQQPAGLHGERSDQRNKKQGEEASIDIARSLRAIGAVKGVDVVIVARGGGSIEDLWAFNEEAVARAIGDKKGIRRYGHAYVPLDEALSRVVIDFSGRPGLEYHVQFKRALIGEFDVDLVHEFFQGFANHAQVTLHIDNLRGDNAHHQCETMFKAFARALRMALEPDPRAADIIPSTKGTL